jgi:uncharacterized protein YcfJ
MKKLWLLTGLLAVTGWAHADEVGRVISSTPVVQQVPVTRQVCAEQAVAVQQPRSGAGALMGALAGGAIGNSVGRGSGRAAATLIGLVGGAAVGDQIEGNGATQVRNVQQCSNQTSYENRATAWNVVYEYAGQRYSVQMPNDPGPTVRLQVSPVNVAPARIEQTTTYVAPPVTYSQPVYVQAPVYTQPMYAPAYYGPPPVGVSLNLGWSNYRGWGHHHEGHWR